MNVQDDLYLGPSGPSGFDMGTTASDNPTSQNGCGPMGRIVFRNIVPLTLGAANVAALQTLTANTAMTLTAGTGVTTALAPDGSGRTVYVFDVARAVSLTSTANLSAISATVVGFDEYGVQLSQLMTCPNNTTVNSLKAFKSILSVTPGSTSASQMSIGTSDVFGLQFRMIDAGYIVSAKWANVLAQNAGTFTAADTTSPATTATGDVRGTFAQSGAASNGSRRLVIAMHLDATQCGSAATASNAFGVTQA